MIGALGLDVKCPLVFLPACKLVCLPPPALSHSLESHLLVCGHKHQCVARAGDSSLQQQRAVLDNGDHRGVTLILLPQPLPARVDVRVNDFFELRKPLRVIEHHRPDEAPIDVPVGVENLLTKQVRHRSLHVWKRQRGMGELIRINHAAAQFL